MSYGIPTAVVPADAVNGDDGATAARVSHDTAVAAIVSFSAWSKDSERGQHGEEGEDVFHGVVWVTLISTRPATHYSAPIKKTSLQSAEPADALEVGLLHRRDGEPVAAAQNQQIGERRIFPELNQMHK